MLDWRAQPVSQQMFERSIQKHYNSNAETDFFKSHNRNTGEDLKSLSQAPKTPHPTFPIMQLESGLRLDSIPPGL